MKYNAVKHMIETDAGDPLARLTGDVSAETGFAVADAWSGLGQPTADEIEYEAELAKLEDEADKLEAVAEKLGDAMRGADAILANAQFDLQRLCDWMAAGGQNPNRETILEECRGILNALGEVQLKLKVEELNGSN